MNIVTYLFLWSMNMDVISFFSVLFNCFQQCFVIFIVKMSGAGNGAELTLSQALNELI
jgi:hypothetical protein